MNQSVEELQAVLQDHCNDLAERVKLLRDYATTPNNIWLARGELHQIQSIVSEIDHVLGEIKRQSNQQ